MMKERFHILECTEVLEDEETDIYVVNLKTKEVRELSANVLFAMHHINAYEINNGAEIVLDLSPTDELALKTYPVLDNMMNPTENSTSDDTSTCGAHEVTRYHINLETNEVTPTTFPNLLTASTGSRFINKFDMGVINEAFRGREVSWLLLFKKIDR
jgi:carotenoid cleavage dioxygenase-like enzyme